MADGQTISKKRDTISALFTEFFEKKRKTETPELIEFSNDNVKHACRRTGFKNPFDVTKIDRRDQLSPAMIKLGYSIIHLGSGKHAFIKCDLFRKLPIPTHIETVKIRPSQISLMSDSESKVISDAFNNGIIDDFLFGEGLDRPLVHIGRRWKTQLKFKACGIPIETTTQQVEVDAIFETSDTIVLTEGKMMKETGEREFNIMQLFAPFLHLYQLKAEGNIRPQTKIRCLFIAHNRNDDSYDLAEYAFSDPVDPSSVRIVSSKRYKKRQMRDAGG